MIPIDYTALQSHLKIKRQNSKRYLFGTIRQKYLVLQPEELVRQLVIHYLIEEKRYNKNRITVEKMLKVNDLTKRCDILIFDQAMSPYLLIECKAPNVPISQDTFRQVAWYNMPLQVPFLMVTNGKETFCCAMDYEDRSYEFLKDIPIWQAEI